MKNNYNIEKIIDNLHNKGYTNFINPKELMNIKNKLHKNEYKVYQTHQECNKVILYKKQEPPICLLKINSKIQFRHQDIMGTIFSLGLKEDTFGDIVKYQNEYYVFTLPSIKDYIIYNLKEIRTNSVEVEEVSITLKEYFKQEYIEKEIIVSSLRIDNVVSSLVNLSRNDILLKFKEKEIILNYEDNIKPTKTLRENDIFSVKNFGKFKYCGIIKNTKKGGFIIKILQYN